MHFANNLAFTEKICFYDFCLALLITLLSDVKSGFLAITCRLELWNERNRAQIDHDVALGPIYSNIKSYA